MSIVRSPRPDNHFTTYANEVIRDNRLSYKARGILLELLSRPDNWRVSADALANNGKDGRSAILSGLTELRDLGYIVTYKRQKDNGQFETMSVVYDTPQSPKCDFPTSVYPTSENPTSLEETIKKKREETATPSGVGGLVKLYFDSFNGELPPSGNQVAGQIQLAMKKGLTEERLQEVIPIVAAEGKPLTINTLAYIINRSPVAKSEPTPTPPPYRAEEQSQGVPVPEHLKEMLKKSFSMPK